MPTCIQLSNLRTQHYQGKPCSRATLKKLLTAKQKHWSRQAITVSSNPAADQLWAALGKHRGLQRFFTAAGLTHTSPPSGPRWGNSQITASDQVKLMRLLTDGSNRVLSRMHKGYILNLMKRVVPSQRWGVSAGLPGASTQAIKNGWGPTTGLPGWWINSFGSVSNAGHRYQVAILSSHQASQKIGISRVNRIARGINAAFARYPVKS